jgi:hypothetical protein
MLLATAAADLRGRARPLYRNTVEAMQRLILIVLLTVAACGKPQAPVAPLDEYDVSRAIALRVEEGEGTTIDLAALAPFDWTRFCAFHPYTTQTMAEEALGFRWPYEWSSVEHLDDRNYLVFLKDEDVVAAFDYPRGEGDFASFRATCVARQDAKFIVAQQGKSGSGKPFLVLRQQS